MESRVRGQCNYGNAILQEHLGDRDRSSRINSRAGHLNIRERTDIEQGVVRVHVEALDGVLRLTCSKHRPRADDRAKKVVSRGAWRRLRERRRQCHRAMGIVEDQNRCAQRHARAVDQSPPRVLLLKLAPAISLTTARGNPVMTLDPPAELARPWPARGRSWRCSQTGTVPATWGSGRAARPDRRRSHRAGSRPPRQHHQCRHRVQKRRQRAPVSGE